MSRIFLSLALGAVAIVNAAESQPAQPKTQPSQVRGGGFKPWRWAKALDRKLGEVSIEMSAVKDGKPLLAEKKRNQQASEMAYTPQQ